MSQVISFINMKGGVGKTTLAVNVAYGLAWFHDKKVLLVDADPQFNSSTYLMTDDEYLAHVNDSKKATLIDVFVPQHPSPIRTVSTKSKGGVKRNLSIGNCIHRVYESEQGGVLDIIPSTLGLIEIEMSRRGTENRLHNFIREKADQYDYVLIDCPPTISVFTQAAILASQKYVVPLKPDPLSTIGLPLLERWLEEFTDTAGIEIEHIGIILVMVRRTKKMHDIIDDLRGNRGNEIFDAQLGMSTKISDSVESHQPVFLHARNTKWAEQIVEITDEFLERTSGA